MSAAAMGAKVRYCGHDGWFIADIFQVGNVNVVHAGASRVDADMLTRPGDEATHELRDFPIAGFWNPRKGVFVVPENQVRKITTEDGTP